MGNKTSDDLMQESRWLRILGSFVVSVGLASAEGCGLGSPDDESVAWADGMCTAVNGMTEAATNTPSVDMADPAAAAPRLIGYLDAVLPTLTKAVVDLKTLGRAPMDGGDEYVTHAIAAITTMQEWYESVRTAIAAVNVSDERSAVATLVDRVSPHRLGDRTDRGPFLVPDRPPNRELAAHRVVPAAADVGAASNTAM